MWELPSQQELEEKSEFSNNPLEAGNYVAKIGKIDLQKRPKWNQTVGGWDYENQHWVYRLILLPYQMESGMALKDTVNNEVPALTKWLFREVNPMSMGFMLDNATPSFMRALVAYLSGQDVRGRIKPEGFVLFNNKDEIVSDTDTRQAFINEQSKPVDQRELTKSGYRAIPDIKKYEGAYIACTIEIDKKGRNKVSKFSRLSPNFTPTEDPEKLKSFDEGYQKMLAKQSNSNDATGAVAKQYVAPSDGAVQKEVVKNAFGEIDPEKVEF